MQDTRGYKQGQYEVPNLTLRDMLGPLFRHRAAFIAAFCTIFLISILVAFLWARHYYVATMQVVVARERLDPTVTPQPTTVIQDANQVVTTDDITSEISILQGQDMLREVAQACRPGDSRPSFLDRFDSRPSEGRKAAALEAE